MVALLLSWGFTGWLSLVFGVAGIRSLNAYSKKGKEAIHQTGVDYLILSGFVLVTALTSLVSLVSPINGLVTLLFALSGVGLTMRYRADLVRILRDLQESWKRQSRPLKIAVFTIFTLAMLSVTFEFGVSDLWFYHAQAIQWIEKYAVVPGLGNLHGRFAFNSHFFISSALFTLWFSEEYVVFPILSLFSFMLSVRLLINAHSGLKNGDWKHFTLNTVLLVTCIFQIFPVIHITATDEMSAVLLIYAFTLFLESGFDRGKTTELAMLWGIILLAITFKVSSILTGLLLIFTLPQVFRNRQVVLFFSIAFFILAPFLVRNVLLSGYLLYPVPELDLFSVDWKIPEKEVILEKELVEGWARLPHGGADIAEADIPKILAVPFGEWIQEWWPTRSIKWKLIMIADLFIVMLLTAALYNRNYKLAALCFTLTINLLFWFFKAPDPRFGLAYLLMSLGLVVSFGLLPFFKYLKPDPRVFLFVMALILAMLTFRHGAAFTKNPSPSLLLISRLAVKITPETFQAKNFILNTPPANPPARGIWCFNAPLPCTPYPKTNLMMRGPTLQSGFRTAPENQHTITSH